MLFLFNTLQCKKFTYNLISLSPNFRLILFVLNYLKLFTVNFVKRKANKDILAHHLRFNCIIVYLMWYLWRFPLVKLKWVFIWLSWIFDVLFSSRNFKLPICTFYVHKAHIGIESNYPALQNKLNDIRSSTINKYFYNMVSC